MPAVQTPSPQTRPGQQKPEPTFYRPEQALPLLSTLLFIFWSGRPSSRKDRLPLTQSTLLFDSITWHTFLPWVLDLALISNLVFRRQGLPTRNRPDQSGRRPRPGKTFRAAPSLRRAARTQAPGNFILRSRRQPDGRCRQDCLKIRQVWQAI
jgi:hypothetical protein